MTINELWHLSAKSATRFVVAGIGLLVIANLVLVASARVAPQLEWTASAGVLPSGQDELRVELDANGFTPSEAQHAAGTFAIAVENSAVSGTYTLLLKTEEGTVLKEIEVQKGSAAWTMTLPAGQYTLTEASHPQWLCRITVQ